MRRFWDQAASAATLPISRGRAARRRPATIDGPPAEPCGVTLAPACEQQRSEPCRVARRHYRGSACPDRSRTGLPSSAAFGGSDSGTMARSRIAPANASGFSSNSAAAMLAPLEKLDRDRRGDAVALPRRLRRSRRVRARGGEHPPRRTPLRRGGGRSAACRARARGRAARAGRSRARSSCRARADRSRSPPVPCSSRSGAEPALVAGSKRWMNALSVMTRSLPGSAKRLRSACGVVRGSSAASRSRPSVATSSSTAKPGMSVAISNSTPPGSRK